MFLIKEQQKIALSQTQGEKPRYHLNSRRISFGHFFFCNGKSRPCLLRIPVQADAPRGYSGIPCRCLTPTGSSLRALEARTCPYQRKIFRYGFILSTSAGFVKGKLDVSAQFPVKFHKTGLDFFPRHPVEYRARRSSSPADARQANNRQFVTILSLNKTRDCRTGNCCGGWAYFLRSFLSPKKGKLHHEENHITPDCPQWSRCGALCRRHDPDGLVRLRKHPVPDCRSPLPARRAGTLAHDRPHAWLPDREPVFDRLRARYHRRHGGDASCLPSYAVHQKKRGRCRCRRSSATC